MTFLPRDAAEVDALVTDRYLESLLAADDRRTSELPSVTELDPSVRLAAARLTDGLTRVHPSFRFEERLAARLAEVARRMTLEPAVGDADARPPAPLDVAGLLGLADGELGDLELLDPARPGDSGPIPRRPLIIGGTLASAALSIAGAAIVAWRLSRAAGRIDPIARAARGSSEGVRLA